MKATLVESREIAPEVRHFVFEAPEGKQLHFKPGQFVSFNEMLGGKKITRAYSIASLPAGNHFELCLNLVHEGMFSPHLFDMKPGDSVEMTDPLGFFVVRNPAKDAVFVATGTGIAPFRSMAPDYLSHPQAKELTLMFGVRNEQIAVVRNGLDEAPASSLSGPRSCAPRVVVLSRLVPHKQIEDALEAVAALRLQIPGLHLDIVGDGWWRQRLVDHVRRLGMSDAVTFHGHVDDVTKHHVLQSSWVHVLPSRKEGWGLAVVEAAQHAVPTIGYRCAGGLSDSIVDGVTGLLVDSHAELVDRLERLLRDPVLSDQLGVKAQARSGEFSWTQSADAMAGVLHAVQAGEFVSGVV